MATKKAASTKKSRVTTVKKPVVTKSTKVSTSTATEPARTTRPANAQSARTVSFFGGKTPLLGAYIAEFVGTFILAAVALTANNSTLYLAFTIIAIVMTIGLVSGAHINPLVTVGAWVTRKMDGKRALGYVGAQLLGAMLALVVLMAFSQAAPAQEEATQAMPFAQQSAQLFQMMPITGETKGLWYIFFAEFVGASILSFAVANALRNGRDRITAAFTYGFGFFAAATVAMGAALFAAGQGVIATAVNPALALSLQTLNISSAKDGVEAAGLGILLYVVAPILGGILGFLLFNLMRSESSTAEEMVSERL